ncbi:LamG domain-containing protein [Erythrobacter insulae]|uniref:LamG domain-containing protein n=1 Tax=Erythrobacter insulae TaxID=2584124 RepID=A0A547P7H4_9SPHN|nr:LamG-like jellyroll fold domain-containing protein [Erythrobacter insulae]TRD10095.1 LamG domain-containing protein [Erythrobacter insulae]
MMVTRLALTMAAMAITMPQTVSAQPAGQSQNTQQSYIPLMFPFNGNEGLVLPTAEALELQGRGTIEFWVSAKWSQPLDYDPVIMAYTGPFGTRFSFNIAGDKSGFGIAAGEFYDGVAFDFSDGRPHHVAVITVGDVTDVYIDGELQAAFGFTFADNPVDRFTIGSIGGYSPFIGEIGQVRIWDEPIEVNVLNYFAMRPLDISGPNAHPDIDSLVGMSAFGNPETRGFIFVGEPAEPNLTFDFTPPQPIIPLGE